MDNNQKIIKLINKKTLDFKKPFLALRVYDQYKILTNDLDEEKQKFVINNLNIDQLSEIFENIEWESSKEINLIKDLDLNTKANIIAKLPANIAKEILDKLDKNEVASILSIMDDLNSNSIKNILHYDDDSAGSLMSLRSIIFNPEDDIKTAMRKLIKESENADEIDVAFVLDDDKKLIGTVSLKQLIKAKANQKIKNIMDNKIISIHPGENKNMAASLMTEYDLDQLAVVDDNNCYLGFINIDDIVDVIIKEKDEDYLEIHSLSKEFEDDNIFQSIKNRTPWLFIAILLSLFTTFLIGNFQEIIASAAILAAFQPMISNFGGNVGTQSLALTLLKINSNDARIDKDKVKKLIKRELLVGFSIGILAAFMGYILTSIFISLDVNNDNYLISYVVALSLFFAAFLGNFIGLVLPLFFNKLKLDSNITSSTFITTTLDFLVIFFYLTSAGFLLKLFN